MDEQPKRRWFRFRLSTVLVLTAIVAWGMSCWPWVALENVEFGNPENAGWQSGYYGLNYSLSDRGIGRLSINRRFFWSSIVLIFVALWWLNRAVPRSTQPFWRTVTRAPAKTPDDDKLGKR